MNKPKNKYYDKDRIIAIILFLLLIIVSALIIPIILESNRENNDVAQSRDFHIRMSYNFNNMPVYSRSSSPDIEFDFKMHYPRGTLIVDDPVEISGIAALNSAQAQNVRSFSVGFQSGQAWPITQDGKGITKETDLLLNRIQDGRLIGNTTMVWVLEGTYYPKITLEFMDGTIQPTGSSDVAITVYPKSQLAQIVTNKASIDLAIAAFFLAFVGTINIIYNLWQKTSSFQVGNNQIPQHDENSNNKTNNKSSQHSGKTSKMIAKGQKKSN